MNHDSDGATRPGGLSVSRQVLVVCGLAGAALLVAVFFLFGAASSGRTETPPQADKPKLATFIPSQQQLAALDIQAVPTHVFYTEIVTEGTIAPNAGLAAPGQSGGRVRDGLPILVGQSSDLLQAENDLVTAKAQYQLTQTNEKRQHALYQAEGAALKDWQQSQNDLAAAAAALSSARNRLRMLGKPESEITASNAVFSVGNQSTVWLIANVREADAPLVHRGDPVRVQVAALPQEPFAATISYVASVIDPNTHRLVVGAAVQNKDGSLRPNMLASFTILTGPPTQAPAVPQKAIIYEGDAARVWVAGPGGNIVLRDIAVGRTNGDLVEVTKGLAAGERIVMSGALFIDRAASGN